MRRLGSATLKQRKRLVYQPVEHWLWTEKVLLAGAALGEMTYGVARGMKNFIDVTLGTGVGSGIVINGQMVYGCDGFAGELGHVTMVRGKEGRICG